MSHEFGRVPVNITIQFEIHRYEYEAQQSLQNGDPSSITDLPSLGEAKFLNLAVEDVAGALRVHIHSKVAIDDRSANGVGDELVRLVQEYRRHRLLVDMSMVPGLTHPLIGDLCKFLNAVQSVGGRACFYQMRAELLEILRICRFPIAGTAAG